ncbi:MAG: stage V sporulation protein AB [Lachnospiraceae bacterium]|nr:stage V sporulation protein AB [Lachnospiraceae bacterium]
MREGILGIMAFSFGMLSAAGVFTVFAAVGLVPRFAGKTHTAKEAMIYENMVIAGTIIGSFLSIFERYSHVGDFLQQRWESLSTVWHTVGTVALSIYGIFAGMFIGCLALAIAEVLDSIPIFSRRIRFRHGIGLAVVSMAIGKLCGSLFYFWYEIHTKLSG